MEHEAVFFWGVGFMHPGGAGPPGRRPILLSAGEVWSHFSCGGAVKSQAVHNVLSQLRWSEGVDFIQ